MNLFAALYGPGNGAVLVECARFFSPHVEAQADLVVCDLTGLGKLFGDAREIGRRMAARVGIPAGIGIAENPDCAAHAARGFAGVTVIGRGEEGRVLAPLPVNLLQAPTEIAEALEQWGIRTFGQFGALPPLGVAARLGDAGVGLWRQARGEGSRLLLAARDPLRFAEEMELDDAVELLEPLSFLLSRMLHEICGRLERASLAASELRLWLGLEDGGAHQRVLTFPVPMADPMGLLKLLQLDLQGRPPSAPVCKISLEAEPARPRVQQHGLFLPMSPEPQKLELTIARIAGFVGEGNVGTPELVDTHRPDAFRMGRFGAGRIGMGAAVALAPVPERVCMGLRRLRPPRQAHVQLREGRPARLSSPGLPPDAQGEVVRSSGPWRTSGDWWAEAPWDHDEWDVELVGGGVMRIYLERGTGRWFVDGRWD